MAGAKRAHRATFATDKRKGGYLIRVTGPNSNAFVGREVPVTLKNGNEEQHTLEKLIWSGKDNESGEPVSLYAFAAKPRTPDEQIEF